MRALFLLGAVLSVCNFLFAVGSLLAFAFFGWEAWAPLEYANVADFYRVCFLFIYYAASIGLPFLAYNKRT